jgi:hypothetical protein
LQPDKGAFAITLLEFRFTAIDVGSAYSSESGLAILLEEVV